MSDPAEAPAKPAHNLRGAILWTAGILLFFGLAAWFAGAVVVPARQAHKVLSDIRAEKETGVGFSRQHFPIVKFIHWRIAGSPASVEMRDRLCADLGGKTEAAKKLGTYMALPDWLAPRRLEAIYVLSNCGQAGVEPLIRQLTSTAPDTRCAAAWALGEIGPDSAGAITILERLVSDPDKDTVLAAKGALCAISPQPSKGP